MRVLVILVSLTSLARAGEELAHGRWTDEIYLMDGSGKAFLDDCPRPGESGCYAVDHNPIVSSFWEENFAVINAQGERLWDTVVAMSSFPFSSSTAFAFYAPFCNDVRGLGPRGVSPTPCRKPTGYSFMNNAEEFVAGNITWMLDVMGQEMEHQFGAFVRYQRDGECSEGLLGRDDAHWSFWVDTDGAVMEGNRWQDLADGTFLSLFPAGGFTDTDLYLWGFIPPEEVPPFFIIDDPVPLVYDGEDPPDRTTGPTENVIVQGTRYEVGIDDIIACEGFRDPPAELAPKISREALILVSRPFDQPDRLAFDGIRRFRREWNIYFYVTVDFTARVITTQDGIDDMPYWEFGHREEVDALETSNIDNLEWISDTKTRIERRAAFDVRGPDSSITIGDIRIRPSWEHFNFETEEVQEDPLYNSAVIVMSVDAGREGRLVVDCGGTEEHELRFPLIADDSLHTYSVAMPDEWDCAARSVTLYPSDREAYVEIDKILFALALDDQGEPSNADHDGDGFVDAFDNCPRVPNPDQADGNRDGFGDACEDTDRDGMPNGLDNCPLHFNGPRVDRSREGCQDTTRALLDPLCLVQDDADGDGIGDACDPDFGEGCSCAVGGRSPRGPSGPGALFTLLVAAGYVFRRRGSTASRSPSPKRL